MNYYKEYLKMTGGKIPGSYESPDKEAEKILHDKNLLITEIGGSKQWTYINLS